MNRQLQFSFMLFLKVFNNRLNSSSVLLLLSVAPPVVVGTAGSTNLAKSLDSALAIPEQSKDNAGTTTSALTASSLESHHHRRNRGYALFDSTGTGTAKFVETSSPDLSLSDSLGSSKSQTKFTTEHEDHQVSLTSENIMSRRMWKYRGGIGLISHAKATILTLIIAALWIPMLLIDGETITTKVPILSWMHQGSSTVGIFRWIVTFLYFVECALCSTRRYLSNSLTPMELGEYIQHLQSSPPQTSWFIECYHYRTVHAYSQTREGNTRRSTSQEKVITHRARKDFEVSSWRDATESSTLNQAIEFGDNNDLKRNDHQGTVTAAPATTNSTFVKATISILFVFANAEILSRYSDEEAFFCATEGQRDTYYDFQRSISVGGSNFRHKILVVRTGLSDIRFASKTWFWIFSFVGLTVPYRVWFANHCYNSELTVTKHLQ